MILLIKSINQVIICILTIGLFLLVLFLIWLLFIFLGLKLGILYFFDGSENGQPENSNEDKHEGDLQT